MPTLELIAEIQFLKTRLARCQERLAETEKVLLLCLPLTQWVMSLNFDEINDVSDLEGMYEPARKINEMIQVFLSRRQTHDRH